MAEQSRLTVKGGRKGHASLCRVQALLHFPLGIDRVQYGGARIGVAQR